MYRFAAASAALLASTALAQAGGVERNAFTTAILFEQGTYVELGYSMLDPSVSGTVGGGAVGSGDMASSYGFATFSYRQDLTDRLSFAFVIDEPVGANVSYPVGTGYPFAGSTAELRSTQLTAALRYDVTDRVSVYGGLRALRVEGEASIPAIGGYTLTNTASDYELGYMIGAAYQIPDIALRVALTYFSEVELNFTGTEFGALPSAFNTTIPQSVLLEAQSGVAEGTLVFGSVRWVDWTEFNIDPTNYPPPTPLVSYNHDTWTYTVGAARVLNDNWAVSGSITHEPSTGGLVGNLGPTDGRTSIGLGVRYTEGPLVLSAGLQYIWIGDANTNTGPGGISSFTDNTAVGAGIRIGYRF